MLLFDKEMCNGDTSMGKGDFQWGTGTGTMGQGNRRMEHGVSEMLIRSRDVCLTLLTKT